MDPVSLVLGALAAGAGTGVTDVASSAITDAYQSLKQALGRWFKDTPGAELALREHASDPVTWEAPLAKAVRESGAAGDEAVVLAAQQLLALVEAPGTRTGKYVSDVRDSPGTVIGDNAYVTQTFGVTPGQ
jgi:hypothetical protein